MSKFDFPVFRSRRFASRARVTLSRSSLPAITDGAAGWLPAGLYHYVHPAPQHPFGNPPRDRLCIRRIPAVRQSAPEALRFRGRVEERQRDDRWIFDVAPPRLRVCDFSKLEGFVQWDFFCFKIRRNEHFRTPSKRPWSSRFDQIFCRYSHMQNVRKKIFSIVNFIFIIHRA